MEKETNIQQIAPTQEQYEILLIECRKEFFDFDFLSSEEQGEAIAAKWLLEREQGVKKLTNYFIVGCFYVNEGLIMQSKEEKSELSECIGILRNQSNNITQEFLEERLSSHNPLLVQDDYGRVIGDYWDFVRSIDSLKS